MKKLILITISLIKEIKKNDLVSIANNITFKMILSIFPFFIFLITILGFLEIDIHLLCAKVSIPKEFFNLIENFLTEIFYKKRPTLLKSSLLFSIISASSGFKSLIYGINKIYNTNENRNFLKIFFISVLIIFIFNFIIISFLLIFIFNDKIILILNKFNIIQKPLAHIFNFIAYILSLVMMVLFSMIINKISIAKKVKFISLLPGSLFTVIFWILSSKIFNIYINNFSKISYIYGSIAGIIISMLWINIMALVLLIGSQINVLCERIKII